MVSDFVKSVKIPAQDKKNETTLNKYYNSWVDYMNKYYPEWAAYPAYIWRGWGYFVDNTKSDPVEEKPEENDQNTETNDDQMNSNPLNKPGIEVGQDAPSIDPGMGGESN